MEKKEQKGNSKKAIIGIVAIIVIAVIAVILCVVGIIMRKYLTKWLDRVYSKLYPEK